MPTPLHITILAEDDSWHVRDLRRAAEANGHHVRRCAWTSLAASLDDAGHRVTTDGGELHESSVVITRVVPAASLERIVLRMDMLQRLEASGVLIVNGPRAIEAAVDKYLSLARIAAADLPVPPTAACQRASDAMRAFDQLGGDVIIKPLFGAEGFGMSRVTDRAVAQRTFNTIEQMQQVIYLQQTLDHGGSDLRLFVVGDEVVASIRRRADETGERWRTNLARGGRAEAIESTPALKDIATRAARACGAVIGGVDIAIDQIGQPFVLEVNAAPGWRGLSRETGIDIAQHIITFAESRLRSPVG